MESKKNLETAVSQIEFRKPICPIYQNVNAVGENNPTKIKKNIISQLVKPVMWYQTIQNMINDGANSFSEVGPGNVLTGLNKRINRNISSSKVLI